MIKALVKAELSTGTATLETYLAQDEASLKKYLLQLQKSRRSVKFSIRKVTTLNLDSLPLFLKSEPYIAPSQSSSSLSKEKAVTDTNS